jgi:hypothetical protein
MLTRSVSIMKLLVWVPLMSWYAAVAADSPARLLRSLAATNGRRHPEALAVHNRRSLQGPNDPANLVGGKYKTMAVAEAIDTSRLIVSLPTATDAGHRHLAAVQGQVTALQLINADTDQVIVELEDTMVIALDAIPNMTTPFFNINATVSGNDIRLVRYGYNGNPSYRTEYTAPFAFCGNDKSNFYSCDQLGLRTHTVTVTPRNRNGKSGRSFSLTFTIVETDSVPPVLLNFRALTPTTVNVTSQEATVVFQVVGQDDASGLEGGIIGFDTGRPGGFQAFNYLYGDPPTSPFPFASIGPKNNDIRVFNVTMRIRKYIPAGTFPLFANVADFMINVGYNEADVLQARGLVSNITIINSIVDTTKPSILAFAATSPLTVNATVQRALVNFTVTVQDDLSGIDFGYLIAFSPETDTFVEFGKFGVGIPADPYGFSGFVNNGPELPAGVPHTFQVSLLFEPEVTPAGQYKLQLAIFDGARLFTLYNSTMLAALGLPSVISVV